MKDRCPSCGYRFGLRGASYKMPAKGGNGRLPLYHCPNCGVHLRRVVPAGERLASIAGYGALLIASSISLWQMATLSQLIERDWLLVLYGVSVIGIGVSTYSGLTRQHYHLP